MLFCLHIPLSTCIFFYSHDVLFCSHIVHISYIIFYNAYTFLTFQMILLTYFLAYIFFFTLYIHFSSIYLFFDISHFFFFFNIPLVYLIYSSVFSSFLQECLTWIFRWSITMEGDSTSARPPSWCSSGNRIHITWRKSTPDPSSSRYYKNWKERTWSR